MASKLPETEVKVLDEYLAKYPTLAGTALARVAHGDGAFSGVSEKGLAQRFQYRINQRKAPAPTPTEADGEQIAITGTITREEYDKLALKARKYDHFIRVLFAGAKNNIRVPEALYFDNRLICEQLRGLEPELYLKTFEIINREAGK